MKPVCSALGVARSHVALKAARPTDWVDGRTVQTFHQPADAILVDAVRAEITALVDPAHKPDDFSGVLRPEIARIVTAF